jgi:hypothetical protein
VTFTDHFGLSDRVGLAITRLLQTGIASIAVYGLVVGQFGLVLTAGIPLCITFVPALLRRNYNVPLDWGWTLWISVAVGLHTIGMMGAYKEYPLYDSVAHVVSGGLVAACGYALTMALYRDAEGVSVPDHYRGVYVLVAVLALGVLWEDLEHTAEVVGPMLGMKPPVVQYGAQDTAKDLVADLVGGILVALFATPAITAVPRALARKLGSGRKEPAD